MIVLVGESASGKSTVEKILEKDFGYRKIVSYTTRQPRNGETNGVDYYFVSDKDFKELKDNGFFVETAKYNGWNFGTPLFQYAENSVLVVTPCGLRSLIKCDLNITSFYINVPRRERLIKILQRGDNIEEAIRRNLTDCGQYDGIEDEVNYVINNEGYLKSPDEIAKEIYSLMEDFNGTV